MALSRARGGAVLFGGGLAVAQSGVLVSIRERPTGLAIKAVLMLSVGVGSRAVPVVERGYYDGFAVRYDIGVFEMVEHNRGLPHAACNLASPRHAIGTWVWVEGVKTDVRRRCRVSDTSQPQHRAGHIKRKIFELDPASGALICGAGWKGNSRECPIRVSR